MIIIGQINRLWHSDRGHTGIYKPLIHALQSLTTISRLSAPSNDLCPMYVTDRTPILSLNDLVDSRTGTFSGHQGTQVHPRRASTSDVQGEKA